MTVLIGLSGKARHGKGSVVQLAQILMQKGDDELEVRQVSFATRLKTVAKDLVLLADNTLAFADYLHGCGLENWETITALRKMTTGLTLQNLKAKTPPARKLLQFIGTEAFRRNVDDLYWVKLAAETIKALPLETQVVFVPDCRFINEADYVRSMGGQIWRVERYTLEGRYDLHGDIETHMIPFDNKLSPEQKAHPSETELDTYEFDAVLRATNMDDLFHAVEDELKRLGLI